MNDSPTMVEGSLGEPELVFSDRDVKILFDLIKECGQTSFRDLGFDLSERFMTGKTTEPQALKLLGEAFSYVPSITWNRARIRVSLESVHRGEDPWPPKLQEVPEPVQRTWEALYGSLEDGAPKARLADLLLSSKYGHVPARAAAFVESAILALKSDWDRSDRYDLAMRAISVVRQFRISDLVEPLHTAVLDEIERCIDTTGVVHHLFLRLAHALKAEFTTPAASGPQALRWQQLLDRLWLAFEQSEFADYAVPERLALARNNKDRESVQSQHVRHHLMLGQMTDDGVIKQHHFMNAAQLAKGYELNDLHDEAIRSLQDAPRGSMDWQRVESNISIPRGIIEREIQKIVVRDDWKTSLQRFLQLPAPTGDHARNVKTARGLMANHPLRHTFTSVRVGIHELPESIRTTEEQALAADLGLVERVNLQAQGGVAAAGLMRLRDRFPQLTQIDMAAFFSSEMNLPPKNALVLGEGIQAFWNEDFQHVGTATMFQIERVARELSQFLGLPVYRAPVGESRGRFPSLETYLDGLDKEGFEIEWSRTIRSVLMADGWNLRNTIAHGYVSSIGPIEAVLILRILGTLSLATSYGSLEPDQPLDRPEFRQQRKMEASAIRQTRRVLSRDRRRRRRG